MTAPATARATAAGQVDPARSPVRLPGDADDNSIAREPLWHAYGEGADHPEPPPWTWAETPPPDSHVPPPPPRGAGHRTALPPGATAYLSARPYPATRHPRPADGATALAHALTTAFAPLRREPENPYNEHRPYASPRCLFPVHAFVDGGAADAPWRLLEPTRHALTGTPDRTPPSRIALTGRYSAIPAAYQWFRGSLVAIELGMVLRALTLGLELFDVPAALTLPGADSDTLLRELDLGNTWEWSLPWQLDLTERLPAPATPAVPESPVPVGDPALTDVVRVNRRQRYPSTAGNGPTAARLTTAVPAGLPASAAAPDWAELLWQRHSGRMPRGLHGMDSSARHPALPADVLRTALAWLAVPPPHPALAAAFDAVRVSAVVQHVEGHEDGVYRARDGRAELVRADPAAPAALEEHYGYGVSPVNGCGVANAPVTVFFSVRPRELFARFGPAGWGAAQHACGWAVHGLCLSAAASGLFARPVRAFKEIPTQGVIGLGTDETIVLSAVVGVPRSTGGALLDLRT
ncbi:hypothetical protein OG322_15525 [Streptomyces sp. NBC_01260]|uniref:hypothetical protein n=1 Tax=Streptomyces sp. NBC_01260 TaxID=2903801 RepID=UPI002E31D196|nr:hypothetical protein [Streptomyces sp. NBC_01260]